MAFPITRGGNLLKGECFTSESQFARISDTRPVEQSSFSHHGVTTEPKSRDTNAIGRKPDLLQARNRAATA